MARIILLFDREQKFPRAINMSSIHPLVDSLSLSRARARSLLKKLLKDI